MTGQILFGAKNSYWQSNAAQCRPTQRAPDWWESARFQAVFLPRPAHQRVTPAVSWLSENEGKIDGR